MWTRLTFRYFSLLYCFIHLMMSVVEYLPNKNVIIINLGDVMCELLLYNLQRVLFFLHVCSFYSRTMMSAKKHEEMSISAFDTLYIEMLLSYACRMRSFKKIHCTAATSFTIPYKNITTQLQLQSYMSCQSTGYNRVIYKL